jgi:GNAT superfamily N-acetyltransferase
MVIHLVFRAARNAYPGNRDRRRAALEAAVATIIQSRVMGGMDERRIRAAGREDVGVLAALMTDLGHPSSVEDMGRRFEGSSADPSYATVVAERDGVVLGTVGLHLEHFYEQDYPFARIMAFVVAPEHRGRGIGRALISAPETSC